MSISHIKVKIETIEDHVLIDFGQPVYHIYLPWEYVDDFFVTLKQACNQAELNSQSKIVYPDIQSSVHKPDLQRINITRDKLNVILVFDRKLDKLVLPFSVARRVWKAIVAQTRLIDQELHKEQVLQDAKTLIKSGVPMSIVSGFVGSPTIINRGLLNNE